MELDTLLTENIELADGKKMYDKICKQILSNKMILAWIMKECMVEYQNIEVEDIAEKYIEGDPYIGTINVATGENIYGMSTEDFNINKGKIFHDIRYHTIVPNKREFIELIVNIEAQNEYNPGYPLLKRGIHYGSSMISGQYGTVFTNSEYQKIKKVYSIWICRDVPKYLENSITSYDFTETNHVGKVREKKSNYDLMSIVMVYLGQAKDEQYSNVLKMLNTLLSEEVKAADKVEFLASDFRIQATKKFEKEVQMMCNLSQGIEQKGVEKGIEKGIVASIVNIMNNLKLSTEEAIIVVGVPESERDDYAKLVELLPSEASL